MREKNEEFCRKQEQASVQKTIKVSDLLKQQGSDLLKQQGAGTWPLAAQPGATQQVPVDTAQQIELYTTLSRSLLELHNDMRNFRTKGEGLDRVVFSIQQAVNQNFVAIEGRLKALEEGLNKLVEEEK